jgi:hypothetical protein
MTDPTKEKAQAKREEIEADWEKLKAKLKESSADTKIFFKEKLSELQELFD